MGGAGRTGREGWLGGWVALWPWASEPGLRVQPSCATVLFQGLSSVSPSLQQSDSRADPSDFPLMVGFPPPTPVRAASSHAWLGSTWTRMVSLGQNFLLYVLIKWRIMAGCGDVGLY